MSHLKKNYESIFLAFLIVLSCSIIFRQFSTVIIFAFILLNIIFLKKLSLNKNDLILILIISSPFLLDILFFMNNDNYLMGVKHAEKRLSLLLFPLILIGYQKPINLNKVFKFCVFFTSGILIFLFIRYIIVFNENFLKYINGVHLFQMGYDFARSFGTHAPALNLHICFATVLSIYLAFHSKNKRLTWVYLVFFLVLFFFVLYINTRMGIINCVICSVFIVFYETIVKNKKTKSILKRLLFLGTTLVLVTTVFIIIYPRLIFKFTEETFTDLDKIGRIDDLVKPETKHGSLVLRLSIWKSALELAKKKWYVGYGASDSKNELVNYFKQTNQEHLAQWKFATHNQYLDFLLKFGVLGTLTVIVFISFIGYLGSKLKNSAVISFFLIFLISNLTDDFLIRFDGIVFSAFWVSIFANQYKYKTIEKEN